MVSSGTALSSLSVEPHGDAQEAPHLGVVVHAHGVVPGQPPQDGIVLDQPQRLHDVANQEHDLAAMPRIEKKLR
jgi:hypothetical protein